MTPEQRKRAELGAELAAIKLYLVEMRAGSLRRAADVGRLLMERHPGGVLRAFLELAQQDLVKVTEAAEAALAGFEGVVLSELVAGSGETAARGSHQRGGEG